MRMAIACPIDLDTLKLRAEIQSIYARVAAAPSGEFHFHRGPGYAAQRLHYDAAELSRLPGTVTESFAGIGNPHAIAALPAGATGVDMTEAMRDRARRGAAACGLAHVEVRAGEATALPIETESADVVISNGVL